MTTWQCLSTHVAVSLKCMTACFPHSSCYACMAAVRTGCQAPAAPQKCITCAESDGSKYSMATRPSTELSAKPVASGKQRTQRVWNLSELSRSCSGRPASSLHARSPYPLRSSHRKPGAGHAFVSSLIPSSAGTLSTSTYAAALTHSRPTTNRLSQG